MEELKEMKMNELGDKINDMKFDMQKVKALMERLAYEHFNIPSLKEKICDILDYNSPIFKLVYDYDQNWIAFEILYDYILSTSKKMDALYEELFESNNKDTAA